MNDHLDLLDLTGIDQPHVPDAAFQATLRRRVAAIVDGREPSDSSEHAQWSTTVELQLEREANALPQRGRLVRTIVIAASVAAAVAVIAVVVTRDEPTNPADTPSPPVTIAPAPTPTATTSTVPPDPNGALTDLRIGPLDPGTYAILGVDGQRFNVAFTVPVGWRWDGRSLSKGGFDAPDGAAISFYGGALDVYADPCHWDPAGPNPPISGHGSAVVSLLAAQPTRRATTAEDRPAGSPVAEDIWPGRVVELSVPDDIDFAVCDGGEFRSWGPDDVARSHQSPGQRDVVWGVDIDSAGAISYQDGSVLVKSRVGGLVVDAASFAGTPANVMSELQGIFDSIRVGNWG